MRMYLQIALAYAYAFNYTVLVVRQYRLAHTPKGVYTMQLLNLALSKTATHAPRTGYNQAMWAAVNSAPGIATGITFAALHAHLLAQVPGQSPQHCTAHIKYLVRQKAALVVVQPKTPRPA